MCGSGRVIHAKVCVGLLCKLSTAVPELDNTYCVVGGARLLLRPYGYLGGMECEIQAQFICISDERLDLL